MLLKALNTSQKDENLTIRARVGQRTAVSSSLKRLTGSLRKYPPTTITSRSSVRIFTICGAIARGNKKYLKAGAIPECYRDSQQLAANLLMLGSNGIVYPSVRLSGGTCVVCFRPALIVDTGEGITCFLILEAGHYSTLYRWLSLGDISPNLAHDFAFLCSLHESHLLRVVQSHGPGMLQAGHGGDRSAVIPFVSTSEWPTPVHAIYRAGTRSTIAKYS